MVNNNTGLFQELELSDEGQRLLLALDHVGNALDHAVEGEAARGKAQQSALRQRQAGQAVESYKNLYPLTSGDTNANGNLTQNEGY